MLPITCDSLEHGNPTKMAQHSNTYSSRLEAFPDELVAAVFEQIVYVNSGHPFPDQYRSCKARENLCKARKTFRNLCLVSKRVYLIARPYLYQTASIEHTETLMKLCRTIAGNQHLTEQIKVISLGIGDLDEIAKLEPAERQRLRDDCLQHIGDFEPQMSQGVQAECDLIGILCYKLLARAVNLSSLEIGIDTTDRENTITSFVAHHRDLENRGVLCHQNQLAFFGCVTDAIWSAVDRGATAFLPRLEALAIEAIGRSHRAMSAEAFQPFLGLPSLRIVRSTEDDGDWSRLSPGPGLHEPLPHLHDQSPSADSTDQRMANRNITTLDISQSMACQYDIQDIVQLFPCLEVLEVWNDSYNSMRLEDYVGRASRIQLSSAIESLTALRTLHISIYPPWGVGEVLYDDITASLGPGKVLNLARMQNLQRLEVPVYMLARSGERYEGIMAVPHEVLPRSLKTLVLLAMHGCKRGCIGPYPNVCIDKMETAVEFLESLGDDLTYFPHLDSVVHYHSTDSFLGSRKMITGRGERDEEAAEYSNILRLKAIHALFSEQNVQLEFQGN